MHELLATQAAKGKEEREEERLRTTSGVLFELLKTRLVEQAEKADHDKPPVPPL